MLNTDEMSRIVVCKHCGNLEYYGEMRWLSGFCGCRNCYKARWQDENHKLYLWSDLDGPRPTFSELASQEGGDIFKNNITGCLYVYVERSSEYPQESVYRNLEDNYTYTIPDKDMVKCN